MLNVGCYTRWKWVFFARRILDEDVVQEQRPAIFRVIFCAPRVNGSYGALASERKVSLSTVDPKNHPGEMKDRTSSARKIVRGSGAAFSRKAQFAAHRRRSWYPIPGAMPQIIETWSLLGSP
jgi:hypothetical protein